VRVPARFAPSFGTRRVADGVSRQTLVVRIERERGAPPSPSAATVATYEPPTALLDRRARAEDALVHLIERRGGTTVGDGRAIRPADARTWVESGEFLSARSFRLLERSLEASAPSRDLAELASAPLAVVTVYLLPAP